MKLIRVRIIDISTATDQHRGLRSIYKRSTSRRLSEPPDIPLILYTFHIFPRYPPKIVGIIQEKAKIPDRPKRFGIHTLYLCSGSPYSIVHRSGITITGKFSRPVS